MQNKTARKRNIPMRIAGVLLLLVLISAYATSGLYARYITSSEGSDSARVARFDVSAVFTGTDTDFSLSEGADTATAFYSFSVTSKSEVAVSYDVVLTLPSVLPNGVTFKIDDVAPTTDAEGLIYTFSEIGTFTASGGTTSHTLTVTATDFSVDVALDNIKVEIIASQIQPN